MSDPAGMLIRFCGVYSMTMLLFGTLSNILTIAVCVRKNLRAIPTFVFISFICVMETIPLYNINLNSFVRIFLRYNLNDVSPFLCQMQWFLHYCPLQASAWLLVLMTLERYLSIRVKHWRTSKFNSKRAFMMSCSVVFLFIFINIPLVYSPKYVSLQISNQTINQTKVLQYCIEGETIKSWTLVHAVLYSILPFMVLLVTNSLLVHKILTERARVMPIRQDMEAKRKAISISVMIMTVGFIIFTGPSAITSGIYFDFLNKTYTGQAIKLFASAFRYTFNSFNFFVLIIVNKKFLLEFKSIFY